MFFGKDITLRQAKRVLNNDLSEMIRLPGKYFQQNLFQNKSCNIFGRFLINSSSSHKTFKLL